MPIYAVNYTYCDNADAIAAGRPNHRAYLGTLVESGQLLASGPLVGGDRDRALLIFKAASAEAVEQLLTGDPFQQQNLVERHDVTAWNALLGAFKEHLD